MKIDGEKVDGIFEKRLNRFVASVKINDKPEYVHVPNSGRLKELLTPGARVILQKALNSHRKYPYDLIMVYKGNTLVSIDSTLPSRLLASELSKKKLLKLDYDWVKTEVPCGNSRFDIALGNDGKIFYYMEVKGVTLVEEGKALFPDAPTERGAKHMIELAKAKKEGFGAGVFFVVQRDDAEIFSPNDSMDENFGKALRVAANAGVELFAYSCRVTQDEVVLLRPLPVQL
ncbi:Sugar fermentation stimulation protein A [Fervidicola ferrireducens]|uniref:Sugar fermentation stimulation protein homolog n=1 Tax=Fervidicola ferrireducens TaxID=520764 RepID=A0A140LDR6_9FIRM|nr:DNA/RNA nuclease SfsA [Fervidicola ferrireducens]KXG78691.1 Sugar fermentation stimulation protein A [Fervidicola ferrireducens]